MKPVVAIVGRPNVGKSTLFNRLTKSRDALVADLPGLTRDRQYGEAEVEGRSFIVIDTGGITGGIEEGIDAPMAGQSMQAVVEATTVLFLVDGRAGINGVDLNIANQLRNQNKKIFLVVNKTDGIDPDVAAADFYSLGLGTPFPIAAAHGRGVTQLILATLPERDAEADDQNQHHRGIKIGIIGRPNVGKSTLVNRMLGEERVVVYDMPGTTRDSVYIPYERHGKEYTLIDTAGVRRKGKVKEAVEKFSVIKTLQAIDDANVAIMVFDAHEGLVDQDLHLLGYILDAGTSLVIALNKWDGTEEKQKQYIKRELERRLTFVNFAKIHFISALHGTGVGHLYESVEAAYKSAMIKPTTNFLTNVLVDAVEDHQPPLVRGRRIKLRYAHLGGSNPPVIVIHGNQTSDVPVSYQRYLENLFRKVLKLQGTPIRIEFRSGDNPFAGRRNKLNQRQMQKKRRLMKHVKKK